jgi:hypothetical protein
MLFFLFSVAFQRGFCDSKKTAAVDGGVRYTLVRQPPATAAALRVPPAHVSEPYFRIQGGSGWRRSLYSTVELMQELF